MGVVWCGFILVVLLRFCCVIVFEVVVVFVFVIGEVLVDEFYDGLVVGGVFFNVVCLLVVFGVLVCFVSCIGVGDMVGCLVLDSVVYFGFVMDEVQCDELCVMGCVSVYEEVGGYCFEIYVDVVWEYFEFIELVCVGLVYFGSLVQCYDVLCGVFCVVVKCVLGLCLFDFNLCVGIDMFELVVELLMLVDWVKFNEDELVWLLVWFELMLLGLMVCFVFECFVLMWGVVGYVLFSVVGWQLVVGEGVVQFVLVDSVGVGDVFMVVLLVGLFLGCDLGVILQFVNCYVVMICGVCGLLFGEVMVFVFWCEVLYVLLVEF